MKQALAYVPPIIASTASKLWIEALEEAKELHEAGKYIESVRRFIDGLGRDFRAQYGNADNTVFVLPHGSILVKVELTPEEFRLSADFLRIPAEGGVPMLRQVAELNTRRLMLARFVKHGDTLSLEYHCPIAETHPYKLYGLFGNVCYIGDQYDDEFCSKFGAERIYTPQITPYPAERVEEIYAALQQTGRFALETVREFSSERNHSAAWLTISTVFLQFLYYAHPKGSLEAEVDKALNDLDDNLPTSEQVIRAVAVLEELLSRSSQDLAKDLYYAQTLSSSKRRSSLQDIQESLEKGYEEATQCIQSGNYERVVVRLLHVYYRAYHHFDMQTDIDQVLSSALRAAGGKGVEEASHILYRAVRGIMNGQLLVTPSAPGAGDSWGALWERIVQFFKKLGK